MTMNNSPKTLFGRLILRDQSLWPKGDDLPLGWMGGVDFIEKHASDLMQWASSLVAENKFERIVLMGMGGSSLAAAVFHSVFGRQKGFPDLIILDTTSPAMLEKLEINNRTLFIVSSKSGTTIETLSLHSWLYEKARVLDGSPNERFMAITDSGTELVKVASTEKFLDLFINPEDIGGRFSALSYFAVVPAALLGIDLVCLGRKTRQMWSHCQSGQSPDLLNLVNIMNACSASGYGILGIDLHSQLTSLFPWIEQLVAESTGKQGKGILPVDPRRVDKRMLATSNYRTVRIGMDDGTSASGKKNNSVRQALFTLQDEYDLGGTFMLWMAATSIVASCLEINAFDQPDVETSKRETLRIVEDDQQQAQRAKNQDLANSSAAICLDTHNSNRIRERVEKFCSRAESNSYLAILAYLPRESQVQESLEKLADAFKPQFQAVTIGYGPGYLHSTGQFHKGGPQIGCFLQIVEEDQIELAIPGRNFGFNCLHRAQADGDFQVLEKNGRPILRLLIRSDRLKDLDQFTQILA